MGNLPRAVVEANERADALLAQRNGTPAQAPAPVQQQAAPAAQAPAAPAQAQSTAGEPAPAQAPAPAPAAPQTPAFDSAWEQKYRVLDGKYKAEVPRLQAEIKELRTSVADLQGKLAEAQAKPAPRVEFTAEEREQFGDELLAVVARVAAAQAPAAAAAPQVDLSPVTERMQRLESVVAETAEDKFFDQLGKQVPNWEAQNVDAGFLAWLKEPDAFAGRIRQEMFDEAYNALDLKRIVAFFKGYPNQSTVERTNPNVPSLESQVAPDTNRSAPPVPAGKKHWTRAEVQQFYTQVRRGDFQGRLDEMARIEQDIFAAQQEGRLR